MLSRYVNRGQGDGKNSIAIINHVIIIIINGMSLQSLNIYQDKLFSFKCIARDLLSLKLR
jgi:uncharacterized membrane protein YwzB